MQVSRTIALSANGVFASAPFTNSLFTRALVQSASRLRQRTNGLLLRLGAVLLALSLCSGAALAAGENTASLALADTGAAAGVEDLRQAQQLVENITTDLIELVKQAQGYVAEDEPRFYRELGTLLQRYVDFESFSRAVMGKYASSSRLDSLSTEERDKLESQVRRFNDVFSGALISTYGKGLLVFEGEEIEVLPPPQEAAQHAASGKAQIQQLIHGDRPEPYVIYYSLRKSDAGDWRIRNMIIESSNLGKIYRNQFDNAFKVYEGNIDRVIDNWVAGTES
ncbi:MAG: ABC transporter substrate-binding protein [Pseudomonadales bacterium]